MPEHNEPVTIEGQLAEDPKPGRAADDRPYAWLSVRSTWPTGESLVFTCYVWDKLADRVGDAFLQGDWVIVTGQVRQQGFDNPQRKARPIYVLDAYNVGPSLRHHDVTIVRPEGQPDSTPASPAAAPSESKAASTTEPAKDDDEVPAPTPHRRATPLSGQRVAAPRLTPKLRTSTTAGATSRDGSGS